MSTVEIKTKVAVGSNAADGVLYEPLTLAGVPLYGFGVAVNLTPHAIVVDNEGNEDFPPLSVTIPPSGWVARAQMVTIDRLSPLMRTVGVRGGNLPDPVDGVYYIVSALVGQQPAARKRDDIIAPDTDKGKRDEQGRIVSVPGFVRYDFE